METPDFTKKFKTFGKLEIRKNLVSLPLELALALIILVLKAFFIQKPFPPKECGVLRKNFSISFSLLSVRFNSF